MKGLISTLRKFRDDDDGSMSVELVIVTPIIVWTLLSTYVYFDAYRVEANVNRASLVLAEMFSREDEITPAFLNGAEEVLRTLTFEEVDPDFRLVVYRYRAADDRYIRIWGDATEGMPGGELTDLNVRDLGKNDKLPAMNTFDHNILVETSINYDAPFSAGLGPFTANSLDDITFSTFTIIRPRNNRLCFNPTPGDNDDSDLVCGPG